MSLYVNFTWAGKAEPCEIDITLIATSEKFIFIKMSNLALRHLISMGELQPSLLPFLNLGETKPTTANV